MSNSFMSGMRSAALGRNVRSPDQRSQDQGQTVSGNPMTPFNTNMRQAPVAPMSQQQQALAQRLGGTPMPKQYIAPQFQQASQALQDQANQFPVSQRFQPGNDQPPTNAQLYAAQQQAQGQPQGVFGGMMQGNNGANLMGRPQWTAQPPGNIMQQAQAPVQQPSLQDRSTTGGHYGGMGGPHYTAPRWQ